MLAEALQNYSKGPVLIITKHLWYRDRRYPLLGIGDKQGATCGCQGYGGRKSGKRG